jgi:hypothetical protein
MSHERFLNGHATEQAAVERLFRASMDVQCALSMIGDEHTTALLLQTIDNLDLSIKQVQGRALDQWDLPERIDPSEPGRPEAVVQVAGS